MSENAQSLSFESANPDFRSGFVAIVGPANAGKSTLLNALVGAKVSIVSPKQQTTRNRVTGIKTTEAGQIVFVDTPGFFAHRYRGELAKFLSTALVEGCSGVDRVLLVVDGTDLLKSPNLPQTLAEKLAEKKIAAPAIIAINKVDLCDKRALLPMMEALAKVFVSNESGEPVEIVPVSARNGEGIENLLALALKRLPVGPALFPTDIVSDESDEFLASEVVREKLFTRLQKELPYSLAVRVESWEDSPELLKIKCVILVERDGQKRIVIGEGGKVLKAVGTSARIELERIYGTKVYLELFVRVETDWTKSSRGMQKAGYRR